MGGTIALIGQRRGQNLKRYSDGLGQLAQKGTKDLPIHPLFAHRHVGQDASHFKHGHERSRRVQKIRYASFEFVHADGAIAIGVPLVKDGGPAHPFLDDRRVEVRFTAGHI